MQSTNRSTEALPDDLYDAIRMNSNGRYGKDDEEEDDIDLENYSPRSPHRQSLGPLQSTSSYIGEAEDNRWIECVPHKHAILDREMSAKRREENQEIYNELLSNMQTFRYQNP